VPSCTSKTISDNYCIFLCKFAKTLANGSGAVGKKLNTSSEEKTCAWQRVLHCTVEKLALQVNCLLI
jgi:hypothetical protein